ncbi:hypothetical protein SAMN03159341_13334 [Paenibacillus sp. 1_12]|nr:hypothetical protein SAMN03159341_13334 [Paenibacillus sp. 1_12]
MVSAKNIPKLRNVENDASIKLLIVREWIKEKSKSTIKHSWTSVVHMLS